MKRCLFSLLRKTFRLFTARISGLVYSVMFGTATLKARLPYAIQVGGRATRNSRESAITRIPAGIAGNYWILGGNLREFQKLTNLVNFCSGFWKLTIMKTHCSSFFKLKSPISSFYTILVIGLSVHRVVCYFSVTLQPLIRDFLSDFWSTTDTWKVERSDLTGFWWRIN